MTRPLKIVHAAQFQLDKCGSRYFSCDMKFHQGIVRLGHMMYPYSINDVARMHSPFNSKPWGKRGTNRDLVTTCKNIQPDLLMLGHSQSITLETLLECRLSVPEMKIALWYVDPLWERKDTEHLYQRRAAIDAIFATSAGPLMAELATPYCCAVFIPNPVDSSIETGRNFELQAQEIEFDLIFIGPDKRAPERKRFLEIVHAGLHNKLLLGIFGSLGMPDVYNATREHILSHSKMALSLNRKNDVLLYSSDRMAQLIGNGLLTFTADGAGFQELFTTDDVAYSISAEDLVDQALKFAQDDKLWRETAQRGHAKIHHSCANDVIAKYMIDVVFNHQDADDIMWPAHLHR